MCISTSAQSLGRTPLDGVDKIRGILATNASLKAAKADLNLTDAREFLIQDGNGFGAAVVEKDDTKAVILLPRLGGQFLVVVAELMQPPTADAAQTVAVHVEVAYLGERPQLTGTFSYSCTDTKCAGTFAPDDDPEIAYANMQLFNWECLISCAPECASCGTNYWCWLRCAAQCAAKCF